MIPSVFIKMFLVAWVAVAQRISGELRLQVTDVTGSTLQASGSIVGQATGVERTFETDDTGRSTIRGLPPGRYELIVRSTGFGPHSDVIEIQSQLPIEHRVTLDLLPLNTTVDVT